MTEFSDDLGVSRSALHNHLNGEGNLTLLTLEHIAERLGAAPASLLLGVDDPEQREFLLLLGKTAKDAAELPEDKRLLFAELFLEIVKLWDKK